MWKSSIIFEHENHTAKWEFKNCMKREFILVQKYTPECTHIIWN